MREQKKNNNDRLMVKKQCEQCSHIPRPIPSFSILHTEKSVKQAEKCMTLYDAVWHALSQISSEMLKRERVRNK